MWGGGGGGSLHLLHFHDICLLLFPVGIPYTGAEFGSAESSVPILMDDVHCYGNELRLADCGHVGWGNHNCGHSEDVGVSCCKYPCMCDHWSMNS